MTLRIAVVGVGWAGTRHIEAARNVEDLEVVAVVDPDLIQAQKIARQFGVDTHATNLDNVVADSAIDAVSICSPHQFHYLQVIQALDAGKHVLCEKPLAVTVAQGEEMVSRAAESGRRLFVAESEVYRNLTRMLARVISDGCEGTISSVSVTRGFSAMDFRYTGRRDWLTDPEKGGTGTWMLHGVHTVAQLRYLFGDITRVMFQASRTPQFARDDIEATVSGVLTTTSGLPISLIQTSESPLNQVAATHRVHCARGVIVAGDEQLSIHTPDHLVVTHRVDPDGIQPYVRELEAFVRYIGTGDGPTSGASELETLRVIEAGYRSMETGWPVELTSPVTP